MPNCVKYTVARRRVNVKKNINRNYDVKWQDDLKLYEDIYSFFALEGCINDLYPVKKTEEVFAEVDGLEYSDEAAYNYYNLSYTIAEMYKDKYCVVFYDHTKKPKPTEERQNGRGRIESPVQNNSARVSAYEKGEYGTFEIYHAQENDANVEMFDYLFSESYVQKIENSLANKNQNQLSRDMIRIRDAISMYEDQKDDKPCKPFMFLLKSVSRFMIEPGLTKEGEFPAFNLLFEISQLRDTNSKVLLFVDKMNDLPTWLESENNNYRLKKLYVSKPDGDFKTKYFLNELCDLFAPDYSVLRLPEDYLDEIEFPAQYRKYRDCRLKFDNDMNRFNAFTEGFTVQTLQLFKAFLEQEIENRADIKNISDLVQKFKLGNQTNPWESPYLLNKIKDDGEDSLIGQMKSNILGQDPVLEKIHKSMKQAVTGINRIKDNDRRPRAVFFLAGPTGTGKTEVTKLLARELFGSEDRMIRFDMSEFSASHTDARLFGAPPGYVGYEAGGELTQAVKQNPFSIILFDEIEKANEKILDKFLQILGDGRLTDGKGETVYFSDSIIVFTSNCGIVGTDWPSKEFEDKMLEALSQIEEKGTDEEILNFKVRLAMYSGIKASSMSDEIFNRGQQFNSDLYYSYITSAVKAGVKAYFEKRLQRPELLGRIGEDNIIVYNFMTSETAPLVANKTIKDFEKFLYRKHNVALELTDEVRQFIINRICSFETLDLGARGIVMATENMLREPISDYLISRNAGDDSNETVTLFMEDSKIVCR